MSGQQRLWVDFAQRRVDRIADELPMDAWHRRSVGEGSKGPRGCDWAAGRRRGARPQGLVKGVLVRRSVADPGDPRGRAYSLCLAPPRATGEDLALAAGKRWSIEGCFEAAKQETGLDQYELRSWDGWRRHVTLSILALAFLAAVRARAAEGDGERERKKGGRT